MPPHHAKPFFLMVDLSQTSLSVAGASGALYCARRQFFRLFFFGRLRPLRSDSCSGPRACGVDVARQVAGLGKLRHYLFFVVFV